MHNMLKDKMSSFVFNNFSKNSYNLVSKVAGKEEIYYRDNRLVVLVEDAETGKRIYDVVKSLKDWEVTLVSKNMELKIEGYVADKFSTIQMFFADVHFNFENSWKYSSTLDKLQELISFIYAMRNNGYLLDNKLFNNETCTNLSDFLSFFRAGGSEEKNTNGCIIKYIHYVLSNGGNLDEYYAPIIKENRICKTSDFPYYMPIITMCYYYCLNGSIPENINNVLEEEKREKRYSSSKFYSSYLLIGNQELSSQMAVTEVNEKYTVYNEDIKIYKEEISNEFESFLEDENDYIRDCNKDVKEYYINGIADFKGNTIGYKYQLKPLKDEKPILDREFDAQSEIVEFVHSISNFVFEICDKNCYDIEPNKSDLNLETDIICSEGNEFRILEIQDLYNLITADRNILKEQITIIFFKLLLAYLEKKYGKLSDEKQILEKKEVRYLSPILAKEFTKFELGESVNISKASNAFYDFINYDMSHAEETLMFDRNFLYNPSKSVHFSFQYEVECKYGIKLQKNDNIVLADNRKVVTFFRTKSISEVREEVEEINKKVDTKIGDMNHEYVKFTNISEIIYSSNLDSDDMYEVVGYITTPLPGVPITTKLLLEFNNKEILQVAGKLISNFEDYYCKDILIDINKENGEFTFYIDILDKNFEILSSSSNSKKGFVEKFFEFLENHGYSSNAFIGIELPKDYYIQSYLIDYARKLDTFCSEHKIYYDGHQKKCPVCKETQFVIHSEHKQNKVFEDDYAIHYNIDSSYNVKIYKADVVNIKQLEKQVATSIIKRLRNQKYNLIQDCFIPCKKALNEEHQFVGYIYNAVDFNNENCSNLEDTDKLYNLPRIKSLIRLAQQVKTLIYDGYSFDKNPFGDVLLCKEHKKQVQIVNVDFLSKNGNTKSSIKWLYEYVCRVINSDKNIDLDTSELKSNLNELLNYLQDFIIDLTNYCPIHKIYYKSDKLFCPKCMNKSKMKKIEIEHINASMISKWIYDNQGGESTIYLREDGSIAKIFKMDEIDYYFKNIILGAVFSKKEILEQINRENHKFKYIVPQKILVDSKTNKILGYVMDKKVKGVSISVLKDTKEVKELGFSRKDILEILITVGEGIQFLHDKANIYIGDLNGRNILVDNEKNVYFLDFDGMGVDNIAPQFSTEGYIDPISRNTNNITKKDDWYSFAIQAFYYLTYTHPFNGIYKVNGIPIDIPEKMERKLSLLGNHGIVPPSISEPWDWMNGKLKNAFYNIFEGESRVSIVPELKEQYNKDYHEIECEPEEEIIRINSKFVAKKNNPFDVNDYDIVRIINNHSAICKENDSYYAMIYNHGMKYKVHFPNCMKIVDILYLKNHSIAVYHDKIIAFNLNTDEEVFADTFNYELEAAIVNEDTLYLTKSHSGENIISKVKFNKSREIKEDKINFLSDKETVGFLVKFNSKFMIIKRDINGTDAIYCNSEKLCNINSSSKDSKYNILYDEITKLWLVIINNGTIITINSSNGNYEEHDIPMKIDDMKVQNAAFNSGVLYIPSQDCLYIINVRKEMTTKRLECNKLITPDSRLCNFNSNGFSTITDYVLYDIYKE